MRGSDHRVAPVLGCLAGKMRCEAKLLDETGEAGQGLRIALVCLSEGH